MPWSISFSLDKKLILLVMAVSVVALGISAYLSFNYAGQILQERTEDQLLSESTTRGNSIEILFDTRIKETQILATDPFIQLLVAELNTEKNASRLDTKLEERRRDFLIQVQAFQELVGFSIGFEDVKIIGKNGIVFFSLGRITDKDFSQDPRFIQGLNEPFVDFEPAANARRKMIVSTPIFAQDAEINSPSIGVIIARMRTANLDEILLNRSGLGQTGEVYLVNDEQLMISESRSVKNAIFSQRVETMPVIQCFANGMNVEGLYTNYKGISIYGSSHCAKDLGFVLLAEIDESETLQPVLILQDRIFQTGLIITAVMGIVAFFLSKNISRPLLKLKDAANEIAEGNFEVRTNVKSSDEIGQLSASFDSMAKKLQESQITIRQKEDVIKQQQEVLLQFTDQTESYCVCMVDIINSTKITAKLSDIKSSEFYSIFLNSMATLIKNFRGIVVKNIGDALLFYFPKTSSLNQEELNNAINCCLTMAESHQDIIKKMRSADLPSFDYRISATYGPVRVASIATSSVDDIFGSTVNRCSKINPFAPPNGVIIGSDLYQYVNSTGSFDFQLTKLSPLSDEYIYAVYVVTREKKRNHGVIPEGKSN